ncbi:TetR/AcrR family transcriptional regulator [Tuberibacillus sp. Marseille-P3662]|uniref:TetR/AcrR family transcriptional regulator n=1 Tax=Tuberibacillus sp. Marseille-P3662 TaxID=1965358 RepID=UPI000A1C9909|nr:TetR/AcrR family transcriptional regulator [Tuberibacillus sp. Marseille-P3662]
MKEKEKLIIEAAIKLFASKGFTATSVQEIVQESGMSKGAFYLYFKSKDALLFAIFTYYYERIQNKIQDIENKNLPSREKFQQQLTVYFHEMKEHKEFIIMQVREQAIPFNEDIAHFIKNIKANHYMFYKKNLLDIYGERVKPYLWDLTCILQGTFHSYLDLITLETVNIDLKYLSQFMLNRADDLLEGLLDTKERPVLSRNEMDELIRRSVDQVDQISVEKAIDQLKEKTNNEDLRVTIDVLEEEMKRKSPRMPVIKGMLTNLDSYPEAIELKKKMELYYHIDTE